MSDVLDHLSSHLVSRSRANVSQIRSLVVPPCVLGVKSDPDHGKVTHRVWVRRTTVALTPSLIVMVLPKCPVCLLAYASILRVGPSIYAARLLSLTVILFIIPVGVLAFTAYRRNAYGLFVLGLIAALSFVYGKFYLANHAIEYLSVALLSGVALWSAWSRKEVAVRACCHPYTNRSV